MVGFILYSCGVLLVGFMGGIMAKHIIDKDTIRQMAEEKRRLHRENVFLKKQKKDTVEVIYSRGFDGETTVECPDNYPDFSKDW